jgi:hypothetical protein
VPTNALIASILSIPSAPQYCDIRNCDFQPMFINPPRERAYPPNVGRTKCHKEKTPMAAINKNDNGVRSRTANVYDIKIFYREAADRQAPALLLLHSFPSSSHMARNLIPLLGANYHVIAPDLQSVGFCDSSVGRNSSTPSAISLTLSIALLKRSACGTTRSTFSTRARQSELLIALKHPERVTAIVSQNGNAYQEGLSDRWNPIEKYWRARAEANRVTFRDFLKPETTWFQQLRGVSDESLVAPESFSLDWVLSNREV